ncbi:MAG: hypothetical protein O7I93_09260 [Gemmatimonadetes bacterium]|nr:hypothetical protein [Gemmatimonadota bacterium]
MNEKNLFQPVILALGITVLAAFTTAETRQGAVSIAGQDGPNISGTWVLNREDSDDPREAMQEAMQQGGGPGQGQKGGGQSGGGRSRGGSSGRRPSGTSDPGAVGASPEQMQQIRRLMQEAARAAQRIVIEQTDSTVVVTTDRGQRVLYSDNRKIEVTAPNGIDMELKTKWDGDKLKVETRWDGGVKITEEYQVKGEQLNLNIRIETTRPRRRVRFNLVYDLAT